MQYNDEPQGMFADDDGAAGGRRNRHQGGGQAAPQHRAFGNQASEELGSIEDDEDLMAAEEGELEGERLLGDFGEETFLWANADPFEPQGALHGDVRTLQFQDPEDEEAYQRWTLERYAPLVQMATGMMAVFALASVFSGGAGPLAEPIVVAVAAVGRMVPAVVLLLLAFTRGNIGMSCSAMTWHYVTAFLGLIIVMTVHVEDIYCGEVADVGDTQLDPAPSGCRALGGAGRATAGGGSTPALGAMLTIVLPFWLFFGLKTGWMLGVAVGVIATAMQVGMVARLVRPEEAWMVPMMSVIALVTASMGAYLHEKAERSSLREMVQHRRRLQSVADARLPDLVREQLGAQTHDTHKRIPVVVAECPVDRNMSVGPITFTSRRGAKDLFGREADDLMQAKLTDEILCAPDDRARLDHELRTFVEQQVNLLIAPHHVQAGGGILRTCFRVRRRLRHSTQRGFGFALMDGEAPGLAMVPELQVPTGNDGTNAPAFERVEILGRDGQPPRDLNTRGRSVNLPGTAEVNDAEQTGFLWVEMTAHLVARRGNTAFSLHFSLREAGSEICGWRPKLGMEVEDIRRRYGLADGPIDGGGSTPGGDRKGSSLTGGTRGGTEGSSGDRTSTRSGASGAPGKGSGSASGAAQSQATRDLEVARCRDGTTGEPSRYATRDGHTTTLSSRTASLDGGAGGGPGGVTALVIQPVPLVDPAHDKARAVASTFAIAYTRAAVAAAEDSRARAAEAMEEVATASAEMACSLAMLREAMEEIAGVTSAVARRSGSKKRDRTEVISPIPDSSSSSSSGRRDDRASSLLENDAGDTSESSGAGHSSAAQGLGTRRKLEASTVPVQRGKLGAGRSRG